MKPTRKKWSLVAPFAALALLASACGGGDDGDEGDGVAERTEADVNDINAMPRDELQQGGTLRWPLAELPPTFNANHLDGGLADLQRVVGALLPRAFVHDAKGRPSVDENYFTSIEKTSDDPQTVVYTINPDATWDNGNPIIWEDMQAQWKALSGTDPAFEIVSSTGYEQIESVEMGEDEKQAIVTFATPFSDWTSLFGGLYPKEVNTNPALFNEMPDGPGVTAGPFTFESMDKTAQTITLVRNDNWWGDPALLERIIYSAIDIDAQTDAFANDEIDFIDISSDVNKLQRAQGVAGTELRRAGGPNFRHITINGTGEILSDVNVRRAVAKGINRQEIADALLGPLGVEPQVLRNHIYMPNQEGYQENDESVSYNPEEAKSMLDEAGWVMDGEFRQKDGKTLEINFVTPTDVASSDQESRLIQSQLAEIGVKVNINPVPVTDFFEGYITPGKFDFTVFSWLGTPYPASSATSIYRNPTTDPETGELVIQQNFARVGSQEIDDLQDQILSTLDRDKVIELANQLDTLIWEEVHSLTTYARPDIFAIKENIANFGAFGFADIVYQDIGFVQE